MEKIFFVEKSLQISSLTVVEKILAEHFGISNPKISRTKNGKPYLENTKTPLFFSITHTEKLLFIAFSTANIGIDAEALDREVNYVSILRRFPADEREEIDSTQTFLNHWVVKESAIKWLDGTIAHDLSQLSYTNGILAYKQEKLPVCITKKLFEGHILSVCCEKDFSDALFFHYTI
jgi:phosphopantetheinyl transferase